MKKKIYTAPALSVEEFEMTQVICTSVSEVKSNAELNYKGPGSGAARGNSRDGIWDEE